MPKLQGDFQLANATNALMAVKAMEDKLPLTEISIQKGIAAGAPESESWRAAFGLMVTIVWLYLEVLRVLSILRGND